MNELYQNSVIATATITDKPENQDCKGEFECENFNAMFVADGLGTFKYAKQSSERVIDFFKTQASELNSREGKNHRPNFIEAFKQAKEKSIAFAVIFLSALPAAAVFIDTGNEIPLLRSNDSILQNRISKNVCR